MLSPKQQAAELINKNQNILIVLPQSQSADALTSGLALALLIKQLDKKADVVVQGPIEEKLSFLPGQENVRTDINALRDFIISIDTTEKKIKQLRYETKDSILKIYLAGPDKLEQKDIHLEPGPFLYDALIVVDAADLEAVGPIYEKYAQLFFEKPILNIDHQSGNEYFGEINLVEPTASSCAEIIADFMNSFFPNELNDQIATCLLTGIIDETHSFQKVGTTPQTFNLASLLISRGAEREKIIQYLYKTKSLRYLKLWGKLLSRLEYDAQKNLAWINAQEQDLAETGCSDADLPAISEEINDLLPQLVASFILCRDEQGQINIFINSPRLDLLSRINLELGGTLKNHFLLAKTASPDPASAKAKIQSLINSLL